MHQTGSNLNTITFFYFSGPTKMTVTLLKLVLALCSVTASRFILSSATCPNCDTIQIETKIDDADIDIKWTINDTDTDIYGFRAVFKDSDGTTIYESPILHLSQRHIKIHQELSGETVVCVQVVANDSSVAYEQCKTVEITDLKAVIGILAGTIFLVPCIVGLAYIIYKDKQVTKAMDYEKLEQSSLPEKDSPITKVKAMSNEKDPAHKGKVNLAFNTDIEVIDEVETDKDSTSESTDLSTVSVASEIPDLKETESEDGQSEIELSEIKHLENDNKTGIAKPEPSAKSINVNKTIETVAHHSDNCDIANVDADISDNTESVGNDANGTVDNVKENYDNTEVSCVDPKDNQNSAETFENVKL